MANPFWAILGSQALQQTAGDFTRHDRQTLSRKHLIVSPTRRERESPAVFVGKGVPGCHREVGSAGTVYRGRQRHCRRKDPTRHDWRKSKNPRVARTRTSGIDGETVEWSEAPAVSRTCPKPTSCNLRTTPKVRLPDAKRYQPTALRKVPSPIRREPD